MLDDSALRGVVVGSKGGLQTILCDLTIDATETALLSRLADPNWNPAAAPDPRCTRVLEYDAVTTVDEQEIIIPDTLDVPGNRLTVRQGYRSDRHVLVEVPLNLPIDGDSASSLSRRELTAREQSMRVAGYLAHHHPAFKGAYLAGASHEVEGAFVGQRAALASPWCTLPISLPVQGKAIPLSSVAGALPGLWTLNESAPWNTQTGSLRDPIVASAAGEALGSSLDQHWPLACARKSPDRQSQPSPATEAQALTFRTIPPAASAQVGPQHPAPDLRFPVIAQVDVLVVGGGTSGATAAFTSARQGHATLLVEFNPGLGGTGTYGGVHSYWFGRRVGFAAENIERVNQAHEQIGQTPLKGEIPKWNIEAKAYALAHEAEDAVVQVLLNAVVVGVILDGSRVRGVAIATRTGPAAVLARMVIDATGDGDVAVCAGANYVYGSQRDHLTMWYSLAQFARPGLTRNNFTSTVEVSNVLDYTRTVLAGRRRNGNAPTHDHGIYISPRESRHIEGEVTLTLTDQLLRRAWEDVISIAFSNHDIKGHSSSDWLRVGLIPPNLEIEIPLRALLPRSLDNLIVVGKAISATHDALPAIRMQADVENMGGAAALMVSHALRTDCSLREIDLRAVQERLVQRGVLPQRILDRELAPHKPAPEDIQRLIEAVTGEHPLSEYGEMDINQVFKGDIPFVELASAGEAAIPAIVDAMESASGRRRTQLAQVLALMGEKAALPVLVEALGPQLQADALPSLEGAIRNAQLPPDQGAMPETVALLYALGMVADARAMPLWQAVVDRLAAITLDDLRDGQQGIFFYIDALCFGMERLVDPSLIPLLLRLHSIECLRDQVSAAGFQPDYFEERAAYLELVIGRALARCGSPEGYAVLITYLRDVRGLLARHALTELTAISGQTFGADLSRWAEWLEQNAERLKPAPVTSPGDVEQIANQDVLREVQRPG
ncbi:MAG: FAD-dependent oxidoreductase [Chloroflexi bacterium]|nr:FAD-dependent oxidoreductase [Chloroflexota bacterium]